MGEDVVDKLLMLNLGVSGKRAPPRLRAIGGGAGGED